MGNCLRYIMFTAILSLFIICFCTVVVSVDTYAGKNTSSGSGWSSWNHDDDGSSEDHGKSDDDSSSGGGRKKPKKQWQTSGNKNIDPDQHFLGTTDEADLVIKTGNVEQMRVTSDGTVFIGEIDELDPPTPGLSLDVNGLIRIRGGSPFFGAVLTSDSDGTASWMTLPSRYTDSEAVSAVGPHFTNDDETDPTVDAKVAVETSARESADTTLQGNIDEEAGLRITGDNDNSGAIAANTSAIEAEETARLDGDNDNSGAIATNTSAIGAEETARIAGDTANTDAIIVNAAAITTETTNRVAGDTVNAGAITTNAAAIATETTNRVAGDDANAGAITTNAAAIATETTNRVAGDDANAGAITTNAAAIVTETTDRIAGDDANAGAITTNAAAITTETTDRIAADSAIQVDVDANATAIGADNDPDPKNEIQALSQVGEDVTLSNGGGVISVADGDSSAVNELNTGLTLNGAILGVTDAGAKLEVDLSSLKEETDPVYSAWNKSTGISITETQVSDLVHFKSADETDPTVPASVKDGTDWTEVSNIPADIADGDDGITTDPDPVESG